MISKVIRGIYVLSVLMVVIGIEMIFWQDENMILPIKLIFSGAILSIVGILISIAEMEWR